ncbi:unnamed protein product [Urochloa decumbens]|uniref:Ubiquitin-like protease family profile domain-containing protein n=1 Tax=Urochloa decumbens TaxID=240449 RepID=A0ABC9B3E4_9POAL
MIFSDRQSEQRVAQESDDNTSEDDDFEDLDNNAMGSQRDERSNLQSLDDDQLFGVLKKIACNAFRQLLGTDIGSSVARGVGGTRIHSNPRVSSTSAATVRKKTVKTRQNVCYFAEIVEKLKQDPRKCKAIEHYGFGPLLSFENCIIPLPFSCWIADHIQVKSDEIVVKNKSIPISVQTVQDVLGIPIGGRPIQESDSDKGKKDFLGALKLTTLPNIKSFGTKLLKDDISDDEIVRSFLIVALCTFLCPNSNTYPSPKYLLPLVDVKSAREWDWSGLVYSWLMKKVRRYQKSRAKTPHDSLNLGGCLYVIDTLDDISALYTKHAAAAPSEAPCGSAKSIMVDLIHYFYQRSQIDQPDGVTPPMNNAEASTSRPFTNIVEDEHNNCTRNKSAIETGHSSDYGNDSVMHHGQTPLDAGHEVPWSTPPEVGTKEGSADKGRSRDPIQPMGGCESFVSAPVSGLNNTVLEDNVEYHANIVSCQPKEDTVVASSSNTELVPSSVGGTPPVHVSSTAETEKVPSTSSDGPDLNDSPQAKKRKLCDDISLSQPAGQTVATRTRSRRNSLSPTSLPNINVIIDNPESILRNKNFKRPASRKRKSPLGPTNDIHVIDDDSVGTSEDVVAQGIDQVSSDPINRDDLSADDVAVPKGRQHEPKLDPNCKLKERLSRVRHGYLNKIRDQLVEAIDKIFMHLPKHTSNPANHQAASGEAGARAFSGSHHDDDVQQENSVDAMSREGAGTFSREASPPALEGVPLIAIDSHGTIILNDYLIGNVSDYGDPSYLKRNCKRCFEESNRCRSFQSSDHLIFPIFFEGHWFVFIAAVRDHYFVFLDPVNGEDHIYQQTARSLIIPKFIEACNEFTSSDIDFQDFVIHYAQVPQLDKHFWSKFDDGIFVMKYMELWDPYVNMMVQFQSSNINDIRVKYVSDMVFSEYNKEASAKSLIRDFPSMVALRDGHSAFF